MTLDDKAIEILKAIDRAGDLTVDEFVSSRGLYVNSWAPTFTKLRQNGLITRTGEKRRTSHGAEAFVLTLTQAGREALAEWTVPTR